MEPKTLLRRMFDAAVAAAQPALCIPRHLPERPRGRLIVIGAGKASAAMARAVEDHWDGPLEGLVVTRYGHAEPCRHIRIVEAAHPVPDAAGLAAAKEMLELVSGLSADDLVLGLWSGGGSALLPLPANSLTLDDKQRINQALLRSGASISEMNCVRRHLSAIKGGRLAAACAPARVVNLMISDVPGDQPHDIASGPAVPDASTREEAIDVLNRYRIDVPEHVRAFLASEAAETLRADDPRLPPITTHMIATPRMALEAAAEVAREADVTPYILGDAIEGEARDLGKVVAGIARHVRQTGQPFAAPCVLLSGGEATVTVRGNGRGGRNVEFLLSLAVALDGIDQVWALAGDTDGVDGAEEVAGAVIGPDTLARAWQAGMPPRQFLDNNDGHTFFARLDDRVVTGPTRTNVNDFRAVLITAGQ